MKKTALYLSALPLSLTMPTVWAQTTPTAQPNNDELSPIVVVAAKQDVPTQETIDPKTALQPLPAQDGADLLKSVAGVNVIRKGGSSGDPLLRGLGGSRLLISANDQFVLGGCPARMDPPTAYLFPASYDRVIVTKGPQAVNQGPGMIAGSVRFIRDEKRLTEPTAKLDAAVTRGSFARRDAYFDGTLGNQYGWLRINATENASKDYKDGSGKTVHSAFNRHNQMIQGALTPTADTLIAAQYERSRGHADYADRSMDGSQFDRDAWSVKLRQQNITSWLSQVQLEYGYSDIDHVMDNFSYRNPPPMKMNPNMHMYSVMNPARKIKTAKLSGQIELGNTSTEVGIDWQNDQVRTRPMVMSKNKWQAEQFKQKPFEWSQTDKRYGIYLQNQWNISEDNRLVSGYRHDWTKIDFNPKKHQQYASRYLHQSEGLNAGFLRFEHANNQITHYIGYGFADRAPDYWERGKVNGEKLTKETNHEIDAGITYQGSSFHSGIDLFAGRINHFILMENQQNQTAARQINAQRYGFEAKTDWAFAPHWQLGSSLAYTYGKNRTDGRPLAQTPPLEWRTHLNWDNGRFSVGGLWRVATAQHRYARNQGNIVGMDLGESHGFGTLALNAGWKADKHTLLQLGVDNVFNKTYAEAVNKSSYDFDTYVVQDKRINEPGRTLWARLQVKL